MQLRIPGPTPCPPEVLKALGKQMIDHRGKEFGEIITRITANLKTLFQTKNDLFILSSSGSGGMESAVVNMLSPSDKVLSVAIGVFGERFAEIARTYGANVIPLNFEYGKAADPDEIRKALHADPAIKAVLVTHNETSTGVTNDMAAISKVIREFDKLILVDSISGLGSLDLPVDTLGLDVVIAGSQKGWMVPPGLSFASVSEKAWKAHAVAKIPRFYFDYTKAKKYLADAQTPWTPAISVYFGLDVSTKAMVAEGVASIAQRHAKVAEFTRKELKERGLTIFADEKYASNVVTSVKADEKLSVPKLRQILRDEHKVIIAGGQGKLKGKIFRIGHMGWVSEEDMKEVLQALDKALPKARE